MTYQYEALSPETFQQFCQSLLLLSFPTLQCFPVSQPDGGRDALAWRVKNLSRDRDFVVFQVKFNRKPLAEQDPHKWLLEQISKERTKIKKLIPKGAKEYYLITNVPGTSHLDSGSMDQLQALLAQVIEIPFTCWWRDDLDRRLDSAWSLKWAYPALMTGQDMLITILNAGLNEKAETRRSAILSYVTVQYREDEEVKFKQVELQNKILDLFVDIPVQWKLPAAAQARSRDRYLPVTRAFLDSGPPSVSDIQEAAPNDLINRYYHQEALGAATVLLNPGVSAFTGRSVVEGAPGQGKSTIAQYICQVHRIRLLRKSDDLKKIAEAHRDCPIRQPFKLDLRHYATWLGQSDPFSANEAAVPLNAWDRSLEALLAYQVRNNSGGIEFTVVDLHAVARISAVLIVLDGFDEVADVEKRNLVVDEIQKAVARLDQLCVPTGDRHELAGRVREFSRISGGIVPAF